MIFIDNQNITDPKTNLAMEEYALRNLDANETYLLFYINEPSIIVGKNQNTIEEINKDYVEENNIHVVRRISGGGAVYHDLGNLNFSFITKYNPKSFNNYEEFNGPVIKALNKLGVKAELNGRNDIVVGERKISGNAQFTTKNRMFSHGTLLFNSNIEDVVNALNVKQEKIESKGIKSIRSRVANISEFMEKKITVEEFRKHLLDNIFEGNDSIPTYNFTEEDWIGINKLKEERYLKWEWNIGRSPKFNLQRNKRFPVGNIDVRLNVEDGIIKELKIFGDFFGKKDITDVEKEFANIRYNKEDLTEKISNIDLEEYFGKVTESEFLELIY